MTAVRWGNLLRKLGWHPFLEREWSGRPCRALIALHAGKSAPSIQSFHKACAGKPLIVAGRIRKRPRLRGLFIP